MLRVTANPRALLLYKCPHLYSKTGLRSTYRVYLTSCVEFNLGENPRGLLHPRVFPLVDPYTLGHKRNSVSISARLYYNGPFGSSSTHCVVSVITPSLRQSDCEDIGRTRSNKQRTWPRITVERVSVTQEVLEWASIMHLCIHDILLLLLCVNKDVWNDELSLLRSPRMTQPLTKKMKMQL